MPLTKSQAIVLTKLLQALRPDWEFHGTMAALHKIGDLDPVEASLTAIQCAGDPDARTPAAMTSSVYRSAWKPGSDPAYDAHIRSLKRHSDRVLYDIHRRERDPEGSHAGYLAATQALATHRPTDPEDAA